MVRSLSLSTFRSSSLARSFPFIARNHKSSLFTALKASFLVVTAGNPSLILKRICRAKSARVMPFLVSRSFPSSITFRRMSLYIFISALLPLYITVEVEAREHHVGFPVLLQLRDGALGLVFALLGVVGREYGTRLEENYLRDAPPHDERNVVAGGIVGDLHRPPVGIPHIAPSRALAHLDKTPS